MLQGVNVPVTASSDYTPLDDIDRAILQLLQRDARNLTAVDIADRIDVSDGTIRNRIERLEQRNIIEGYVPLVHYENAGFQLQVCFTCTARIPQREELAKEALKIDGIVEIREIMTGRGNVEITAVAPQNEDVTRVAKALDELGLEIESEELLRHRYVRPFNHFGTEDVTTEEEEGSHEI